ncbi:MAG: WD40 repeat domain-containing protein, partial [Anaerolineales bacterium]
ERNIGFILTAIDWASDGDRLAVGSQNDDIYILDANTGSTLTVLNGHQDAVRSVAWGPDSNMVASTGYDDTVRLWNANAGRELVQLDGHTNDVLSVVFSPDGKTLVSGGRDRQIIVWDVETLEIVNVIQPHQKEIQRIALTPRDGLLLLASVSLDRTVGLFEMRTQQPLNSQFASVPGEAQNLTASSGNSLLVLARRNGFLNFWRVDKETGVVEELIPQKTSEPASLALSPDGTRLALGKTDGTIQIVDIQTNTTILELAQSSPTFGLAFSPDGFTLASSRCTAPDQNSSNPSGCDFGEILLWDLSTGDEPVHIFEGHTNVIRALAFSPNGEILVSGSDDKSIIFWDLVRSAPLEVPLTNHRAGITTLAFSPDGKLVASGSQDNTIILWDVEELAAIHEPLSGFTGSVLSLFFDAGGQTLFSGHRDGAVLQWNVNFDSWLSLACTLAQRNMTPDEWEQFIPDLEYRETCEQALLPTPTPTTTPTPAP